MRSVKRIKAIFGFSHEYMSRGSSEEDLSISQRSDQDAVVSELDVRVSTHYEISLVDHDGGKGTTGPVDPAIANTAVADLLPSPQNQ